MEIISPEKPGTKYIEFSFPRREWGFGGPVKFSMLFLDPVSETQREREDPQVVAALLTYLCGCWDNF